MGEKRGKPYKTPAVLEPLIAAVIAGHTPADVKLVFFDERFEELNFDAHYDLVTITVETFTALRSYQIAHEFRKRGVKVLLGGFHPTLCPDEARKHADSIAIGTVENLWTEILSDLRSGCLKKEYQRTGIGLDNFKVDRSIYAGKKYLPMAMVETSRGCRFNCNFCSVRSFYGSNVCHRSVGHVAKELRTLKKKFVFFADDNIVSEPEQARNLFKAIKPLGLSWASQASITSAADPEFLDEMVDSGCMAVIIGLESLKPDALKSMNKGWTLKVGDIERLLGEYKKRGIMVYGTFVFGYPGDTPESIRETVDFAIAQKLFMANFNMLYPFPGTPIYQKLLQENRLIHKKWWLSRDFRWDFPAFVPETMSPEQLAFAIRDARKRFNSISSIFRRGFEFRANGKNPFNSLIFLAGNVVSRRDIKNKADLRPGYSGYESLEEILR